MSTIEKLIVQIFERKNSIIEQVKHQVELYDQQLASKLVIQGIDPPAWLWNHEAPCRSSDLPEINKQRLISELLLPQQAVPYFNDFKYSKISIPACNFDKEDEPLRSTGVDDVCNMPGISTEVEPAALSPRQKVGIRSDDANDEFDLSRSEFKRSRSRQRALELCSSAKSGLKGHVQDESIPAVSYKNSTPCMNEMVRCSHVEKLDSAEFQNIQHDDDDAKHEGIESSYCREKESSVELDHVCDSIDHACCETEIVGAVLSGKVNNLLQSQYLSKIHHEGDAESEDLKIQSGTVNNSSGLLPIKRLHPGEFVDHICNRKSFGTPSSGHINKETRSPDGDVESEGINIQSSEWNNTCGKISGQLFEHVDGSIDRVCETNSNGSVIRGQMDQQLQFHGTLNVQVADVKSEDINISCSKENSPGGGTPSKHFDHEFDSVELDICCANKNVGAVESMHTESPSAAHGNHSNDTAINAHYLCDKVREELLPSGRIRSGNSCQKLSDLIPTLDASSRGSEISFPSSSYSFPDHPRAIEFPDLVIPGMMEERIEDHLGSTKECGNISRSPSKSESSMQKISEVVPILSVAECEGNAIGVSSSCMPLQNHDHVLESLQSASNSGTFASNEKGSKDFSGSKSGSKSSLISDVSPCMMEERIEDHSGSEVGRGRLSGSLTKSESSMQKKSVGVSIFSTAESAGGINGVSSSCKPLQIHDIVLESLRSASPSGIVASNERGSIDYQVRNDKLISSELKLAELLPSSCGLESAGDINGVSSSCNPLQNHDHVLESLRSASPSGIIASNEKGSKDYQVRNDILISSEAKLAELLPSSCDLEGGNSSLEEVKVHDSEAEVPQLQTATVEPSYLQKEDATFSVSDYPLFSLDVYDQANTSRLQSVSPPVTSLALEDSYNMQVEELDMEARSNEEQARSNEEHDESETVSIESSLGRESYLPGFGENTFGDDKFDGMMGIDQSMPDLEGFTMDTDDEESQFTGGGIGFESSFPGSTLKRASILEHLCQSASRSTPITHFPMTYGLHKTSDLYQSVPNGLLEQISLVGDYSNKTLQHKSYSAGLSVLTDPFSFNVSTPYGSPSKKQWDRSTSSSGLRGERSLNPDLVCFTIEEDSGNGDETGNLDETAEAPLIHATCLRSSTNRKPLSDITEDVQNPPSVSANNKHACEVGQTPKFSFGSHLDSAGTEANLSRAQTKVKRKLGNKFSNKKRRLNDTKENKNFSAGANVSKRFTDATKEINSQKPKFSENPNTITRVSDQQRVLRSNNIVSNISSFIPLIQQKKSAAVVTGKRDVKVKALEAAEAAKRLEEKKENERKMKKEAWKAEKARMEQENLLQLELKKKKKEEEHKKKAAEIAARKRIREEEEKKEKEGKRRRVEETRKQHHEQEKKRADKVEKGTRSQAAGLRMHEKDPNSGHEQCTKIEMDGRKCGVAAENEDMSRAVLHEPKTNLSNPKGSNTLMKASTNVGGDTNLNMAMSGMNATSGQKIKEKSEVHKSYDISPYQGSDDEDEDEEEDDDNDRRKDKFVPDWASKNSLAEAIFSQQHINPDDIFPSESFCSIAEVLIPSKLKAR